MTRGRKKDLTIPPTRSLVQQRDYRARKAHYIASLEERCRKVEEENVELKKELMEAKARLANPAVLLPETAEASSQLMHNLALAGDSLAKFHRLAFPDAQTRYQASYSQHSDEPHVVHQPPSNAIQLASHSERADASKGHKHLYSDNSPPFSPVSYATPSSAFRSPSPDGDWPCCGGILDCDELCEKEDHRTMGTIARLSGLRSTTTDNRLQP